MMLKGILRGSRQDASSATGVVQHGVPLVPELSVPVDETDHVLGPPDAAVTLVEYGRYDCPHCLQALAITLRLIQTFNEPGKPGLRLVYRHFPQELPHSRSIPSAEAAEAAATQGRFWEMHEHLLRHQSALDNASLLAYAAALKLDVRQFAADLENGVYAAKVRAQFEGGLANGVRSTPTFFINGMRHDADWDEETLASAISRAAWIARK